MPAGHGRCGLWLASVALAPVTLGSRAAADEPLVAEDASAAAIYETACAACHGPDGQGMPPSMLGFDVPMPDLTDCDFARREGDSDWYAVTHGGGPMRGFDRAMPAFRGALTEAQIRRALQHIRTFCDDHSWPRGELNFPRPLVTGKAFPEDELVVEAGTTTDSPVAISTRLIYEQRIGSRSQIEAILPLGVAEAPDAPSDASEDDWRFGVGDLGLAVKHALAHSLNTGSIVSLGADVFFPTGDEAEGFGGATLLFEPFVAYGQIVPRLGFLQTQAGAELPADDAEASREAFVRAAFGRSVSQGGLGRTFSPMIEVLAARELVRGASIVWDVLPALQVTLSTRQHVRAALGLRVPVTERDARSDQVLVYLLWDWFDGGLLEGW